MPLHVDSLSRRRFLQISAAVGVATFTRFGHAAEFAGDPNCFALLADVHIPSGREIAARGVNMAESFDRVRAEIVALKQPPAAVLIDGDCAYLEGKAEDYALFSELLKPYEAAGLPLHMTMGNHDHRERFWTALAQQRDEHPPLVSRHVAILETPHANWYLLDSLIETNSTPGELGKEQLAWLAAALDARKAKPAIVMAHHNLEPGKPGGGLNDTEALMGILAPRKHVQAMIFGHTHHWQHYERDGIRCINLPPVAYIFQNGDPNGWVHAEWTDAGMTLELHSLDKQHPANGEKVEIKWRG